MCRARDDYRSGVEVKAGHCRAVGRWLSSFVDDEPEIVDASAVPRGAGALVRRLVRAAGAGATGHADRRDRREADRPQDAPTAQAGPKGCAAPQARHGDTGSRLSRSCGLGGWTGTAKRQPEGCGAAAVLCRASAARRWPEARQLSCCGGLSGADPPVPTNEVDDLRVVAAVDSKGIAAAKLSRSRITVHRVARRRSTHRTPGR